MRRVIILVAVIAVGEIQAGCKAKSQADHFPQVQSLVKDRIGKETRWNRGSAEDKEVEEAIRRMLARELTADDVVQIALLNNRHLQATYEDLGVAQGELVQAGMLKNPLFHGNIGWIEAGGVKKAKASGGAPLGRAGRAGKSPPRALFVPGGGG